MARHVGGVGGEERVQRRGDRVARAAGERAGGHGRGRRGCRGKKREREGGGTEGEKRGCKKVDRKKKRTAFPPSPPPYSQGRVVAAEYPRFWLVTAYVPNSGEGLKRLDYRVGTWDAELASFISSLAAAKPVILAGDLNVARGDADIHNPKTNLRSAGFTVEERDSFAARLLAPPASLTDPWRDRHPDARGYTYWSYRFGCRPKNLGWRIDYTLVSPELSDSIHDAFQLPHVEGSDHCPVGIAIKGGAGGEVEGEGGEDKGE